MQSVVPDSGVTSLQRGDGSALRLRHNQCRWVLIFLGDEMGGQFLLIALGVAVVVGLLFFVVVYNSLVGKKNQVKNAFATIDVQLKKRHDLIPNLVAAVKQYMTHEAELLTKVTQMRAQAQGGGISANDRVALENQLSHAMGSITQRTFSR